MVLHTNTQVVAVVLFDKQCENIVVTDGFYQHMQFQHIDAHIHLLFTEVSLDPLCIQLEVDGRPLSKAAQVRMVGNSVCPPIACALVRANVATQAAQTDLFEAAL